MDPAGSWPGQRASGRFGTLHAELDFSQVHLCVTSQPGAWVDAESLSPAKELPDGWLSALARKDAWERSGITGWDARCPAESPSALVLLFPKS